MIAIRPRYFWIAIPLAIYLFFAIVYLDLPGLQYDELLFVNAALGNVDGTFVHWQIRLLGKKLPLMLMGYIGALKALLYAPIFSLFGMSPVTLRLPVILTGLITLLVTYTLVQQLLGHRVAVITLVLLATDPTFIFANKLDWGPVALMLLLEVLSLYFVVRWIAGGDPRFLVIAGFLLGLGLYNKVIFIWFIAALSIALFLCFRETVRQWMTPGRGLLAAGAFILGCLPLIAFNITVPMATFEHQRTITQNWAASLKYRYRLFQSTLDGSAVYDVVNRANVGDVQVLRKIGQGNNLARMISGLGRLPWIGATLMPLALIIAILLIAALYVLKRLEHKQEIFFFLLHGLLIAVFICLTAGATGPHHAIAVYPFPQVIVGFALSQIWRSGWPLPVVRGLLSILSLSLLVLAQITVDARYVGSFVARGGVGAWSDAIYQLAAFAEQHREKTYLLMDWGLSSQLLFLSEGRLKKEEAFTRLMYLPAEEKITHLGPLLARADSFFLFHAPPFESFPILAAFKSALDKYGYGGLPVRTFYQRDGRPIYLVYQVVRPEMESRNGEPRFLYKREAEDFDAKSGGDVDPKQGASQKKALGMFWGRLLSDYVLYRFTLPRNIFGARLYLRYAFAGRKPRHCNLFVDDNFIETLSLPPTPGYGYSEQEWGLCMTKIGILGIGNHELKLAPAAAGQVVNLDYFCLCEGEVQPIRIPPRP